MVNVGGASAQVNWGSTAGSNLLNGVFILSSDHADATLEFQNPIGLAGVDRTIQVNNGSADIDARLSGAISSSSATGINKTGAGTLELSGVNTYAGNTRVDGGRLLLTGPLLSTNALIIANGASVQLNMDERINNSALVRLEGGSLLTSGLFETVGKLEISGNSVIDLGNGFGAIVTFADSSSSAWSGTLSILNWSGTPEVGGGTDQLYFGFNSAGLTPSQLAGIQFVNPEGLPGGIYGAVMLDSGEVVVVPEPGVWVMIASGLGLLAGVQRVRRRG
jgi:autotransporter-associated beta strand protein